MEMKTIKQLADEIGLPKNKVKYRVRSLPENMLERKEGTIYITEEGEGYIKDLLGVEKPLSSDEVRVKELESEIRRLNFQLELQDKSFEEKMALQKERIEQQQKDIDMLHNLLDQEQKLHAMAQQKVLMLEENTTTEEEKPTEEYVKSWFGFYRRKK